MLKLPRRDLLVGAGIGALAAPSIKQAMADTPFVSFGFPVTGPGGSATPALRNMPDRLADVHNVLDFGLVNDGLAMHDCTAALQNLINALMAQPPNSNSSTGTAFLGEIFFPAGSYYFSAPVFLPTIQGFSGWHIRGAGSSTRLILGTGFTGHLFTRNAKFVTGTFTAQMASTPITLSVTVAAGTNTMVVSSPPGNVYLYSVLSASTGAVLDGNYIATVTAANTYGLGSPVAGGYSGTVTATAMVMTVTGFSGSGVPTGVSPGITWTAGIQTALGIPAGVPYGQFIADPRYATGNGGTANLGGLGTNGLYSIGPLNAGNTLPTNTIPSPTSTQSYISNSTQYGAIFSDLSFSAQESYITTNMGAFHLGSLTDVLIERCYFNVWNPILAEPSSFNFVIRECNFVGPQQSGTDGTPRFGSCGIINGFYPADQNVSGGGAGSVNVYDCNMQGFDVGIFTGASAIIKNLRCEVSNLALLCGTQIGHAGSTLPTITFNGSVTGSVLTVNTAPSSKIVPNQGLCLAQAMTGIVGNLTSGSFPYVAKQLSDTSGGSGFGFQGTYQLNNQLDMATINASGTTVNLTIGSGTITLTQYAGWPDGPLTSSQTYWPSSLYADVIQGEGNYFLIWAKELVGGYINNCFTSIDNNYFAGRGGGGVNTSSAGGYYFESLSNMSINNVTVGGWRTRGAAVTFGNQLNYSWSNNTFTNCFQADHGFIPPYSGTTIWDLPAAGSQKMGGTTFSACDQPSGLLKFIDLPGQGGAYGPMSTAREGMKRIIYDGAAGVAVGSVVSTGGAAGNYEVTYIAGSINGWVRSA
jgi:hypothetical protein